MNFGAKCYFSHPDYRNEHGEMGYEERVILLEAADDEEALRLAEKEAEAYAENCGARYLGYVGVYAMFDTNVVFNGAVEIYSLTMYDDQSEEDFIDNYYLTGGNTRDYCELRVDPPEV